MASINILLVGILLIGIVQGQYGDDGYRQALGDADEPSQDEGVYSSDDYRGNDVPRSVESDTYQDYDGGRAIRQSEGLTTTSAPIVNWQAAKERFKSFYRKLRDKYRALREKARQLGNELNQP